MRRTGAAAFLVLAVYLFCVPPSYAGRRSFFQRVGRGISRTARFVVTFPDKVTRPLGPFLGPIAADLLTQNILRNPDIGRYFRGARNINRVAQNVEEQRRILRQLQEDFRKQSRDAEKEASAVRAYKNEVAEQFAGGDITLEEYQNKVISLDRLAEGYDALASQFSRAADRMTPENTVKAVGGNVFNRLVREIRDGVRFEVKREMQRYFNPEVIQLLGGKNMDFNRILDLLVENEISDDTKGMPEKDAEDFKKRVREEVKGVLERNRQGLKGNWRQEIRNVIDKVKLSLKKEKKNLGEAKATLVPPSKKPLEKKPSSSAPPPVQGKCPNGYTYSPQSGIECIQTNCNSIKNGHWDYTGHCVCGSSGSIAENPKDPNKECILPHENTSCPDCLFACVHLEEKCPSPPKE